MLAEVLLSLSGHPSSLLNDRTLDPSSSTHSDSLHSKAANPLALVDSLHPSELESLRSLQSLSSRFLRIQTFAKSQLDIARRYSLRSAGVRINRQSKEAKSKSKGKAKDSEAVCSHLAPLCATLVEITREYQDLILDLQKSILERRHDGDLKVARNGFLSLNSIKAKVSWVQVSPRA